MTAQEAALRFGAQLYSPWPGDPTGQTPQMFYKWIATRFNDGTVGVWLRYLTFADLWHGTAERNPKQYAADSLTPIPGVDQSIHHINLTSGLPHPTKEEIQQAFAKL